MRRHISMTGCLSHSFRAMKSLPIAMMVVALFLNQFLVMRVVVCRYRLKVQHPETATTTHISLVDILNPVSKLDFARQRAVVGQPNSSPTTANFMKCPTACPMNKQCLLNQQPVEFTQLLRRGPQCKQQFNVVKHQSLLCSVPVLWDCARSLVCVVTFRKYASLLGLAIPINKHSLAHSVPMWLSRQPN